MVALSHTHITFSSLSVSGSSTFSLLYHSHSVMATYLGEKLCDVNFPEQKFYKIYNIATTGITQKQLKIVYTANYYGICGGTVTIQSYTQRMNDRLLVLFYQKE